MADRTSEPDGNFTRKIAAMDALLNDLHAKALAMQRSGLRELDIHAAEVLKRYSETGRTIFGGLVRALAEGAPEKALERATELEAFLAEEPDRAGLLNDLPQAETDARSEAEALRASQKKSAALELIGSIPRIVDDLMEIPRLAEGLREDTRNWHKDQFKKEIAMANNESELGGIQAILQDISRQIGFLGDRAGTQGASTTPGAGSFRNVGAQLTASLDALSLPRDGVQFADEGRVASASDMLIDGLLENYRQENRNGNTVFVPGRTEGRAPSRGIPADILAGASRVAARLVRSEEDVILEILDRLPDMTRFKLRAGVPSLRSIRDRVAAQFEEIDEIMSDPLGVNLPQAVSAMSRAIKATFDFVDYANLETELFDQLARVNLRQFVAKALTDVLEDEVGLRRSVTQAEELRGEIRELADAYARLFGYVSRPLGDMLGRTAARLDRQLAAINRSALDLRATLSRFGTSKAEQDLIIIIENMPISVTTATGEEEREFDMSVGQLIGWIIKTSAESRTQSGRVTALEAQDLGILAVELREQASALAKLASDDEMHRFALGLGSVMRQIEELQALVDAAAKNAATLAGHETTA